MKQTKTLAQVANDIENGNNLHEYYNNDGATIKTGNFESFGDFLSYYRQHYRPILEQVADGITPTGDNARLLRLLASDLLNIFKEDSDESEEDGDTVAVVVLTFSDAENFKRAQRFFDSDGPSQFWAGDWDENARTIEFAEGNDPEQLARMLFESLAPLGEAELYPTFARWCEYMDEMGDDFSERDPQRFEKWREDLKEWQRVADGLTADKTLQYLSDHYNI